MTTFEQEQNKIFTNLLSPIFDIWKLGNRDSQNNYIQLATNDFDHNDGIPLELFITPYCNQTCSYCYLQQHMDDLYPKEIRDNQIILKNLKKLLTYFLENKMYISRVDLFSGEIWGWPFGNQILDIILDYLQKGLKIDDIIIPSNCSFCQYDNLTEIIESYIHKFFNVNCKIHFSISYDGYIIDNLNRPSKNNLKQSDFCDKLFAFARKYDFGFHPMIDANNIEYQNDNYDMWISKIKEHISKEDYRKWYGNIMQLEVRDNKWTDKKILYYLDWLNHVIDTDLEFFFNNDKELFFKLLISKNSVFEEYSKKTYIPYVLNTNGTSLGCQLGVSLMVRLGDLAIIPCHRTSYKKFILGFFEDVDGKLTGNLIANNIPLANAIYGTGFFTKPKCSTCMMNFNCVKYCMGANYENQDLFFPVKENCELQKAKNIFLLHKYRHMGMFDYPGIKDQAKELFKNIEEMEPLVEQWNIAAQLILSEK